MDRGAIISEAWSVMRSNRPLWGVAVLVLVASLLVGIFLGLADSLLLSVAGMLAGVLLTAFLSGSLISLVNAIATGQPINVLAGVKAGFHWLAPLFIINLILTVPVWMVTAVLGGSIAALGGNNGASIVQAIARSDATWLVVFLVSILLNALGVGTERAAVLRQLSVLASLKQGWRLLWTHLGDFVGIGLRLLLVSIGIGLLVACSLMATGFVFGASRSSIYYTSSLTLANIIVLLISLTANIALTVFQSAAWTLAFREWQAEEQSELPVVTT